MSTRHLIQRFGEAGLELVEASTPFANAIGASDVFQMDIRRRRPHDARSEHYLVWRGHKDNLAIVQAVDRVEHQLVMMLHEPRRVFDERLTKWQLAELRRLGHAGTVVFHRGAPHLRRVTFEQKRHFLVGRDERQLFMCRLPRACTTVSQAHEALRAPSVMPERSAIDRPIRQGEWFFVALTRDETVALDAAIAGRRSFVRTKVSIGSVIPRAGKPHVADELVVVRGDDDEREVFVRGAVRHVDHKTIHLGHWRRVLRNREVEAEAALLGGTWID